MAKECPRCNRKLSFFERLIKCQICNREFCSRCIQGILMGKCPYCEKKDIKPVK